MDRIQPTRVDVARHFYSSARKVHFMMSLLEIDEQVLDFKISFSLKTCLQYHYDKTTADTVILAWTGNQ